MSFPSLIQAGRKALILLALVVPVLASAQVDNVYVFGTVKDEMTSKKIDGVTVTVFKNGGKLAEVVTPANGKYEFNLDYGSDYKLVYSKNGMVSKSINIDTRNIPEEDRMGGHGMNVDIGLFQNLPGVDFAVLQQPIGKAKFDPATNEVIWDLQYTEQIRSELSRLRREYEERMKREANADEEYAKLMSQGETAMTAADYKKAVDSFQGALGVKPNDAKATAKLSDAKMKFDQLEADKKKGENYATLIKEADGLFGKKDYQNAMAKYQEASDMKETEAYPKQKMKECQAFIDELAKKAEEEKKKKEFEEKYKAVIAAADASMKAEKYEDARTKYTEASGMKPEEKYPKDQLAEIVKRLDDKAKKEEEERKKKELDAKYTALITAADAAFNAANYDPAKAKYNEALAVKPEEKYPKDQLAAIDKKLEELAKKADEEKLKKELEEKYKAAIAKADAAFKTDKFDDAKAGYNEALGLKPKEKYPQDQLAAIDKRIADLAKKADEDRKKKELDDQYNAAIAEADNAFRGQDWDKAKGKYNEAIGLKSQEKYPKEQLAAIDKAIADAAKKAEEEKKRKELDAKYQAIIDEGNALLRDEKLEGAKGKFQEALGVKPAENYPKEKIAEIDVKLADMARKAEEEKKRKELDDKYNALIAKADKSYDANKLGDALNDYKDASGMKSEEQHPKDRIADIQKRMDADAQAKAEEERLAREKADKEKRYSDLVASADAAFNAKKYDNARTSYTDALGIKPDEKHPQDRLAEIQRILDELTSKNEADRLKAEQDAAERARLEEERRRKDADAAAIETRYNEAISQADIAFSNDNFDQAREKYTEALSIKSEAQYPKDRLALIEKTLADREKAKADNATAEEERRRLEEERRRKAEEDAEAARLASMDEKARLAAEKAKEEEYRRIIAMADSIMGAKQYASARDTYTQALDVKPDEMYPQSKIEQIDKLLAEEERLRREAELASQQVEEEPEPVRENTTIDRRKEQEAEEFMREARLREDAEKYERIKKLKSDVSTEDANARQDASVRRDDAQKYTQTYRESSEQLYSGSDDRRKALEEEVARLKEALAAREAELRERANATRNASYSEKGKTVSEVAERADTWNERHDERVANTNADKQAWVDGQTDDANAGSTRRDQAREEVKNTSEQMSDMHQRGQAVNEGVRTTVEDDKDRQSHHMQQAANQAQDSRMAAKEKLDGTPLNEPRSFDQYARGKLATDYPQGVTEESYTEGNKVIIRRVVVQGNKADEYSKVIAKWGTFYFKNGQSITEQIWSRDTEE